MTKIKKILIAVCLVSVFCAIFSFGCSKPKHEHVFSEADRASATCVEDGFIKYKCSCGETYFERIVALKHDYKQFSFWAQLV